MDNATRKELLYKARAAGYPGSILDVYANYDQGRDLIEEFQAQQRHQQMSGIAAQQSGLQQAAQQGGQQPQIDMQPQPVAMPAIPSLPTPAPNFTPPQPPQPIGVQSQNSPMGIVSGQSGPNQGRAIFKTGGFTEGDPPDWRSILNYKNAAPAPKQNLVGDVRKVAKPTTVEESTNRNVTHQIPANTKELKAEADAQVAYDALPSAMKHQDVVYADRGSATQKAINQIYYALSNPVEAAGHAMKYGYVPQGNLGNYGHRQSGDAFSDVTQFANPMFYANAAYRFGEDASQKNSWTTKEGLINMGADLAESLPFFGAAAKTMAPGVRAFASHPLVDGLHNVYNSPKQFAKPYAQALAFKGLNSMANPLGVPLYKMPGISNVYKGAAYRVASMSSAPDRTMTDVLQALKPKTPIGPYKGYAGGPPGQYGENLVKEYIYGKGNMTPSDVPSIGLDKYAKNGPLKTFKMQTNLGDDALNFEDIRGDWGKMNPKLAHIDRIQNVFQQKKALEKVLKTEGRIALSKNFSTYADPNIAGHNIFLEYDPVTKGMTAQTQDIWKFASNEYAKKWSKYGSISSKSPSLQEYAVQQQAKLMERSGKPFVLQDKRPFELQFENSVPVYKADLLRMKEAEKLRFGKYSSGPFSPSTTPSTTFELESLPEDFLVVPTSKTAGLKALTPNVKKKLGGAKCYTCVGRKRRV